MKEFFGKYPALTTTSSVLVISVIMHFVFSAFYYPVFGLQLLIVLMLGFMSIVQLLMSRRHNSTNKSKLVHLIALAICVIGYFDLVYTEPIYELSDSNVEMIQISDYYVVYVENNQLANIDVDKLKFDYNNPIKAYRMFKTDRFGINFAESTMIKSDLMDDYLFLR